MRIPAVRRAQKPHVQRPTPDHHFRRRSDGIWTREIAGARAHVGQSDGRIPPGDGRSAFHVRRAHARTGARSRIAAGARSAGALTSIGGGSPASALPVSTPAASTEDGSSAGYRKIPRLARPAPWRPNRRTRLPHAICPNRNNCNLKLANYTWVRRPIKLLLRIVPQQPSRIPIPRK